MRFDGVEGLCCELREEVTSISFGGFAWWVISVAYWA